MSNSRRVLVLPDLEAIAEAVAGRFVGTLDRLLAKQQRVHIMLEGGRVHLRTLERIADAAPSAQLDWSRVHFWWGDERWVPLDDPERNDGKARRTLLTGLALPEENIHAMPSPDTHASLEDGAAAYTAELRRAATADAAVPQFDVTFLGVGPDGHTASLFPGREELEDRTSVVIPVRNSPKPPPERLTLSRWALNASRRVVITLAGADKAAVLGLALAGATYTEVPISGIKGRERTLFIVDEAAAAEVPESLITPQDYWTSDDELSDDDRRALDEDFTV